MPGFVALFHGTAPLFQSQRNFCVGSGGFGAVKPCWCLTSGFLVGKAENSRKTQAAHAFRNTSGLPPAHPFLCRRTVSFGSAVLTPSVTSHSTRCC